MSPLLALSIAWAADPDFVQLATGEDFTCGRTQGGGVLCWGNNEDRQLGVENTLQRSAEPVDTGVRNATDLAAGAVQACAVLSSGQQTCWGQVRVASWGSGELPRSSAVFDAASVGVGPARGCTRHRGGRISCWEPEGTIPPQLSTISEVEKVAVGSDHACAQVRGGAVWCWGDDRKGQLGGAIPGWPSGPGAIEGLSGAIDLSVGEHNSCAVTHAGAVWCWGPNADGQLGTGSTERAGGVQQVKGISSAVEVSVGRRQACARTADGKVFCWGADPCPRPDAPSRRLEPVDLGIRGASALSKGSMSDHACAVVSGAPVCWGFNSHGQAGGTDRCVTRP